jgi:hypothetical protein
MTRFATGYMWPELIRPCSRNLSAIRVVLRCSRECGSENASDVIAVAVGATATLLQPEGEVGEAVGRGRRRNLLI